MNNEKQTTNRNWIQMHIKTCPLYQNLIPRTAHTKPQFIRNNSFHLFHVHSHCCFDIAWCFRLFHHFQNLYISFVNDVLSQSIEWLHSNTIQANTASSSFNMHVCILSFYRVSYFITFLPNIRLRK